MRASFPASPRAESARQPNRREVLAGAGALAAGILASGGAVAQANFSQSAVTAALGHGQRFEFDVLVELARVLASKPFAAPDTALPEALRNLTYDAYVSIKSLPQGMLWAGEGRGFVAEPLHRGFVFSNPVQLFAVEDGTVRRIAYDRALFDFGKVQAPANIGDIDFSGFRLHAVSEGRPPAEFAIVQGASFFRAIARGQNYGVTARALTLRPAETRGEEFPAFRAFWLERPSAGSGALVVHGLLDSESVAGAVRMTFRPGDTTIVDVEQVLFPRVELDHIGLAGMAATFYFGPNDRRNVDDARAAVHEVSGLQIVTGTGELVWRPLHNPETLQISAFIDSNPRGFGLLQRDRAYDSFQDDDQRWERRPSLWIEPIGEWGPGAVQLIEIPSDSEVNDNVLAYWRPKSPLPPGTEQRLAFRQFWCWTPPDRPPLAVASATRVGRGSARNRRRFTVDFTGEVLFGPQRADVRPSLSATPGQIHGLKVWTYPDRKTLRLGFELDHGGESASELRLVLEAAGKPLSETWLYRWTP